jgi:hypothetical protein
MDGVDGIGGIVKITRAKNMNYAEAVEIARKRFGEDVYVSRKPKNGFTATNSIPNFLGEISSQKGHNDAWWVYRTHPGRQVGFSPINGEGGAMTKKAKAWSMPDEDWEWLESQPNQSQAIRQAIALYRQQ